MKPVHEFQYQIKVNRSHNQTIDKAFAYVTECKTIYLVTIKICGYALPCVQDWRISKKDASSSYDAALKIAEQAYINGNL